MQGARTILRGVTPWAFLLTLTGCLDQVTPGTPEIVADPPPVEPLSPPPPLPAPAKAESIATLPDSVAPPRPEVPEEPPAHSDRIYQVGGDVVAPRRISGDGPDFAALSRTLRIRGITIFQAVITKEGRVEDVRFLNLGAPELAEPIEEAVKTWRFEPATLHGEPVAVEYNMTFQIRLQ